MSSRLRLFAALELPGEAVAALEALRFDEDVWRRVASSSLHVTLAFLGATEREVLPAVRGAIDSVAPRAVRLKLAAALLLPPRRPHVLTVALEDPDAALAALQGEVASALAATGAFSPESRPFRPHVTVGRVRPRVRSPRAVELPVPRLEFHATAVTLFSSVTAPGGARYEPLASVSLPAGRIDD